MSKSGNTLNPVNDEFSEYVKINMKRAYFTALGFLGNHDDALDASQMAFVQAHKNFDKYDRGKKFFTWYYKILKNICLNILRYKKRHPKFDLVEANLSEFTSKSEVTTLEFNELKNKLNQALFFLNPLDRGIVILKEFENYTYKEISDILDIPIGTVMSKLFYARKKLAERLKDFL
jgi:RNA polymerase sigma-70 factor (ECF subfamily)